MTGPRQELPERRHNETERSRHARESVMRAEDIQLGQTWRAKESGALALVVGIMDDGEVALKSDGHIRWCSSAGLLKHWELVDGR